MTAHHQGTDSGWCRIKQVDFMFFNYLPEAGCIRVIRNTFKNNTDSAGQQRSVYNVGMSRYPSHVGCTPENIPVAVLEHIPETIIGIFHINRSGMGHSL